MEHHLSLFQKSRTNVKNTGSITITDLLHIYNTWRTYSLTKEYENLQKEKERIFQQKEIFLTTINKLFNGRKELKISEKNELQVISKNNDPMSIRDLSSGEKQILILLGETLLQEKKPTLYIADEPELSLHIKWQESLTECIKKVNTNAQIIFATHSPDIVGAHSDKIINMECIFK